MKRMLGSRGVGAVLQVSLREIPWVSSHGRGFASLTGAARCTPGAASHFCGAAASAEWERQLLRRSMSDSRTTVAMDGCKVRMDLMGRRDDGVIFMDTRDEAEKIEFIMGSLMFPSFLQHAVRGMKIGEKKSVNFTPQETFGELNEDFIMQIRNVDLDQGKEIKPGEMYTMHASINNGDKLPEPLYGRVIARTDMCTTLNFNHGLAGHHVKFEMQLLAVQKIQD